MISCFWLVLDLVLVFVGFGLFHIHVQLSFSPYSKDHVLQQKGLNFQRDSSWMSDWGAWGSGCV